MAPIKRSSRKIGSYTFPKEEKKYDEVPEFFATLLLYREMNKEIPFLEIRRVVRKLRSTPYKVIKNKYNI